MQEPIANVSPRPRISRRIGAAVVAVAALLVLTGCNEARGWGSIGAPADGAIPVVPNGKANFAFTYHCDPKRVNGRVYTYNDTSTNGAYPGLKLEGKVERTFVDADGNPATPELRPARSCQEIIEAPAAQFEGSYRSLEKKYCYAPRGRFTILVFDQGNPSLPAGEFTGDGFSIELSGGPYNLYTRAGYIERGNIYAN
jgi:hypothetical protein